MRFIYGRQEMRDAGRAQENCWLLTNGLGGYASMSQTFSVTKGDQGILISAAVAPTVRYTLVQNLRETLIIGRKHIELPVDGYRHISTFVWEDSPFWNYDIGGVSVTRRVFMQPESNTTAIIYEITNRSPENCCLNLVPGFVCAPKGYVREALPVNKSPFSWDGEKLSCMDELYEGSVYVKSSEAIEQLSPAWIETRNVDDENEGRSPKSRNYTCIETGILVPQGQCRRLELIVSDSAIRQSADEIAEQYRQQMKKLEQRAAFREPAAKQLAKSAAAYITKRDSTGGKTIVAGYPFFADWGRDTMISLPGCVLSVNDFETAESILRTFLQYEEGGLVPNLFPEGGEPPRYNTVDAALLLINCVWLYYEKTGNKDFVREAYPVLKRIVQGYRRGTKHAIRMDEDGLISAGNGLDQVTWMDVCIDEILPTPRHGKPVEINAYWYNALCIMEKFAPLCGEEDTYSELAARVKEAFCTKFWVEGNRDKNHDGYLKDVLSGTHNDLQIRCNQIWAVTMPFTMLEQDKEKQIVETVYRHLYTPCGLRTLSPADPEYHPIYTGSQKKRDMAYHQGTVWVFPLGAFYRAVLKVNGYSDNAVCWVKAHLDSIEPMLREGCIGQLPEIYDGENPTISRGCFAQAWSVGEILAVYELLEKTEDK